MISWRLFAIIEQYTPLAFNMMTIINADLLNNPTALAHIDFTFLVHQSWSDAKKFQQYLISIDLYLQSKKGDLKQHTLPSIVELICTAAGTYSWIGHRLQAGFTLAFLLWLSDFKSKTSFGFLSPKYTGRIFWIFLKSQKMSSYGQKWCFWRI